MSLASGRALLDPQKILGVAELALGESYADFGAGSLGHFVLPAAAMVGKSGVVYAVDILPSVLNGIESRARLEGIGNVISVWSDIEHPKGMIAIPPHSVQLVSIINECHLLKKSPQLFANIKQVLAQGGRLLLVDWKMKGAGFGPPLDRRVSPQELQPLCKAQGFTLTKSFEAGPHHWGLLFHR